MMRERQQINSSQSVNFSLLKKKDIRKRGKGWYDYIKTFTNNIIACCWNDSSAVNVAVKNHSKIFYVSLGKRKRSNG